MECTFYESDYAAFDQWSSDKLRTFLDCHSGDFKSMQIVREILEERNDIFEM